MHRNNAHYADNNHDNTLSYANINFQIVKLHLEREAEWKENASSGLL